MPDHIDRVDVRDDSGNVIWVRRKMGWGVRNRVTTLAVHMVGSTGDTDVDIGAYRNALLLVNILDWDGPDLGGKTINQESIDELDADFGEAVFDKIGELNPAKSAQEKKGSTNGIVTGSEGPKRGSTVRST